MAIVYIDVTPPTYTQKTDAAWQHIIHLKSFQLIALRPIVKSLCMPMLLLGTGRLAAAAEALETTRYRGGKRCARRMGAKSVFGFRPRAIRRASGLERDQIHLLRARSPRVHV